MRVLIWFHRDLRTHDHTGLNWALQHGYEIFAVVFSPSAASSRQKLKFWNETTSDLAKNLKTAGISLVISHKSPLQKLPELVASHKIEKIITHKRMNFRDQKELKEVISNISVQIQEMGDLTLYDAERSKELSLNLLRPFTGFKNYVTANWKVPELLPRLWEIDLISETDSDWSRGGEIAGINRIIDYIWETNSCRHYHETRNGMIERDDSSKFSRWLTWGAVSPRFIYHELKKAEEQIGPSKGVSALIYELIWRDYFKFLAQIVGEAFFSKQGLKTDPMTFKTDTDLFEFWKVAETGEDFVDANMRELLLTGWMSNRGRQNVASYLAKTLQIDWTLGASWFEQQLIDEDPENNWGNWQYLAGVGTDPRDRRFDMKKQAQDYDPKGNYQSKWLEKTLFLEQKILKTLTQRSSESSICPSEILESKNKKNKVKMEEVRSAARRLHNQGMIHICQKGIKVNPLNVRGPIRLKLSRNPS